MGDCGSTERKETEPDTKEAPVPKDGEAVAEAAADATPAADAAAEDAAPAADAAAEEAAPADDAAAAE